ncbi:uncharacterized protein LOC118756721 [Rhagoletis pomonella]|uniref:uncharacterized protein LOC118748781 n=1 Tax=Rhagoletis pomonella TaxID=28610 RepID=UPI001781EAD9|nr:uncharacterized protein LOC118748781 [Rhagoletis pomonella]XP_036347360.1 uncharacterized protein LOC118756721 [Rhagoletis pomonella]
MYLIFFEQYVDKSETLAQNTLLRECKVAIKKVERSVCLMTGELRDDALDEVARMLPINTLESVLEVEEKLKEPHFAQAMTTYCHKLKGTSEEVDGVLRNLFTDTLLESFNWDGRGERQALAKLDVIEKVLRGK